MFNVIYTSRGLETYQVKKGNKRLNLDLLGLTFYQNSTINESVATEDTVLAEEEHARVYCYVEQNSGEENKPAFLGQIMLDFIQCAAE